MITEPVNDPSFLICAQKKKPNKLDFLAACNSLPCVIFHRFSMHAVTELYSLKAMASIYQNGDQLQEPEMADTRKTCGQAGVTAISVLTMKLHERPAGPLDLSFWSFLTFLHHGIDKVDWHLL